MSPVSIRIKRLSHGAGLPLPARASTGAAGLDLSAAVEEPLHLAPGDRIAVPTGFAMALPTGFEAQIRPRSGLALRHGLTVLNAPGTVDADYRGEVQVLLINHGREGVSIRRGDRIAQMVITPVVPAELHESDTLPDSERGEGGFGSSGGLAEPAPC